MNHLNILYLLTSFSIGIASISVISVVAIKTNDKFLKIFLLFFTAFTLNLISNLFSSYINTNLNYINFKVIIFNNYLDSFSISFLMFSIILLTHHLNEVPYEKTRNIIFGVISILAFLLNIFSLRIYDSERIINNLSYIRIFGLNIQKIVFILLNIYTLIIGFSHYNKIKSEERKKSLRYIIIAVLIFLPGIAVDMIEPRIFPISFFPILYIFFGILIISYIIKFYFEHINFSESEIPEDGFFKKFDISPREKEVLLLILEGFSNKKICDKLFISLSTVKTHITSIFQKLNVKSRFELITYIKRAS